MKIFTSIILIILNFYCLAQPGTLDLSFNPTDGGYAHGRGFGSVQVNSIAIQSDGKILVAGGLVGSYYNEILINRGIIRLNADGSFDHTFSNVPELDNSINEVRIQADGKIIIAGWFTTIGSYNCGRIARLNSDGSLDLTFNLSGVNSYIDEVVIQGDGKIVIGGGFSTSTCNKILRLNNNGDIDLTFNSGVNTNNNVTSIAMDSEGNYFVGGHFTTFNGMARSKIVKLSSDGSIDNTFDIGIGIQNGNVHDIIIDTGNTIMVVGSFNAYNGQISNNIVSIYQNGLKNSAFLSPFSGNLTRFLYCILKMEEGYLFGGFDSSPAVAVLYKTNKNGVFDSGFGGFQIAPEGGVFSIQKDINNNLIIAGSFRCYKQWIGSGLVKINTIGEKDLQFNSNEGINGNVYTVSDIQTDYSGNYYVAGDFTQYNEVSSRGIIKINENGLPDPNFNIGIGVGMSHSNRVSSIGVQTDGKVIVVGLFSHFNAIRKHNIVRLNEDGSIDETFITATGINSTNNGFDGYTSAVIVQSDGKILVGGNFTKYRGINKKHLIRLLPNGEIDNTFEIGTGFNYPVSQILALSDGRIMVGGSFSMYNGSTCNNLVILNGSGSIDLTFNTGSGLGGAYSIFDIVELPSTKFLVAINGDTWNGQNLDQLIRLNADGTIDLTFNFSSKFNNAVSDLTVQDDGKIIVGGIFSQKGTHNCRGIVRLEDDGTIDFSFYLGSGIAIDPLNYGGSGVSNMFIMNNNSLLICGYFGSINGIGRNRIAKIFLNDSNLPLQLLSFTGKKDQNRNTLFWSSTSEFNVSGFEIQRSADGINFTEIGFVAAKNISEKSSNYLFSDEHPSKGSNYYRLSMIDLDGSYTYSKIIHLSSGPEQEIKIYPNPGNGVFELSGDQNLTHAKIVIIDLTGKIIPEIVDNNIINLSNHPSGVYFLKITTQSGFEFRTKIIKY